MRLSTIAAISTPIGKGGVALLRVSGPRAKEIAQAVFSPMSGKEIGDYPPRVQIYGSILSLDTRHVLDDGLLTYFQAPASFTGEDVVEIACHGGEVISSMILSNLLRAGAEMAEPGEFSRRAFLNGKMSLTSAEGIADLLDAKTEEAALLSSKTARGKLSEAINILSDKLLSAASSLWAYLDYPEEDLGGIDDAQMLTLLSEISSDCDTLLSSFAIGRAVNSGISTAILGKPNVGKSTFFNAFLGENRAIVTALPGTTRDRIEETVKAGRVLLNLSDTAGVRRDTEDQIEQIGIEKAVQAAKEAELVFAVFDLSRPLEEDDRIVLETLREIKDRAVILPVYTKKDLPLVLDVSELSFLGEAFVVSDREKIDFTPFISRIERHFISDESALREGRILSNARQKSALQKTKDLVEEAKEEILSGAKDLASLTLESALSSLLEIDGKSAGEKILDEVFSRFCVGK